MLNTNRTWIVIADGGSARILLNKGRHEGVERLPHEEFSISHPAGHDLTTDRPARVHESHSHSSHAIAPKSDPREARKKGFADMLAHHVDKAREHKSFEHLMLVAPATVMGELRKALSKQAREMVVAEIIHDYTHQDDKTVYQHVKDKLPL